MLKMMFDGNQTSFNIIQHHATLYNMVAKQVQCVGFNNVGRWCIRLAGGVYSCFFFLAAVVIVVPLLVIPIIFLFFSIHLHYFHSNDNAHPIFQRQSTLARVYCGKTNSLNVSIVTVSIYDTCSSLSNRSKNI